MSAAAIKKPSKKKPVSIVTRGKRKQAIARASIKTGTGRVLVNGLSLNSFQSPIEREVIREPFSFIEPKYDVSITVRGGGRMGQAQAVRTAIARALVRFTNDSELKRKMLEYDRSLLVEDPRRVEPKKFKGPKARARFTKSYR